MAIQVETEAEIRGRAERGMALARRITKDSWLAAGVSAEEYDRDEVKDDVFILLMSQGLSSKEAEEWLNQASWEEIERRHQEIYQQKRPESPA